MIARDPQAKDNPTFEALQSLGGGAYAYLDEAGGCNYGFIITGQGVVLLDAGLERLPQLLEVIRGLSPKPILYLINSNAEQERTEANWQLASQGVTVIAHVNTFLALQDASPRGRDILPQLTFNDCLTIHLADQTIELIHPGHGFSPGDLLIHLPQHGILYASDLLLSRVHTHLRFADTRNWMDVLDRLQVMSFRLVVPGRGPLFSTTQAASLGIKSFRNYLITICERVAELKGRGLRGEEMRRQLRIVDCEDWLGRAWFADGVERIVEQLTYGP